MTWCVSTVDGITDSSRDAVPDSRSRDCKRISVNVRRDVRPVQGRVVVLERNADILMYRSRLYIHLRFLSVVLPFCSWSASHKGEPDGIIGTVFTRATLASAGISCRRASVCLSVRLSVCHKSVFY